MIKLFSSFLIIFLLFSVGFAQETNAGFPKKIAFINKFAFYDDVKGIKKLSQTRYVIDQLSCFPLHYSEISEIRRELENPDLKPKERERKETHLKTLLREQEEAWKKQYEKVKKILVDPILIEISDSLKKIETQNNIIIIDAPELDEKGYILGIDFKFDITEKFINYFNNKSKTNGENLNLDIPESKIGVINLDLLFDQQRGIKILKNSEINSTNFCSNKIFCKEFSTFTQSYTLKNGFSFIFDSCKNLPEEIRKLVDKDVTQDFIDNFNNKTIKE
ncbi:MAG TPA: hypothetical protein VK892_03055 [Pyrinomonadaceae bacterium]|nr:hypothetical protein [Pyrinomonadaceae bacterium]